MFRRASGVDSVLNETLEVSAAPPDTWRSAIEFITGRLGRLPFESVLRVPTERAVLAITNLDHHVDAMAPGYGLNVRLCIGRLAVDGIRDIEQLESSRIPDPVVGPLALAAFLHESSVGEFSQVAGDRRLRCVENDL